MSDTFVKLHDASGELRVGRRVDEDHPVTAATRVTDAGRNAPARPRGDATDPELMRTLAAGNLSSLGALYDRYHHDIRQFLLRIVPRGTDAEDLTHEVFLTLPRAASNYDARASARPFLLGIAAQLVRRRRRTLARWSAAISAFALTVSDIAARTPEDAANDGERIAGFERALSRLSDEKRLVFLLIEREGLSGEDVAQALEIPLGTVWTRLHHARAALRRALTRRARS